MSAQDHINAAMDLFAENDLEGAIAAVRRALDEDPKSPDAHEMLGEFCKQAGRLDEAIEAAKKLVELDPEGVMGYVNLSRYYMLKGDKPTAELWQERAHSIPPKKPQT